MERIKQIIVDGVGGVYILYFVFSLLVYFFSDLKELAMSAFDYSSSDMKETGMLILLIAGWFLYGRTMIMIKAIFSSNDFYVSQIIYENDITNKEEINTIKEDIAANKPKFSDNREFKEFRDRFYGKSNYDVKKREFAEDLGDTLVETGSMLKTIFKFMKWAFVQLFFIPIHVLFSIVYLAIISISFLKNFSKNKSQTA